jgi:cathepsin D
LSGKIEGPLAVDDVKIGALVVPNQVFGTAETIDVPLLDEVRWDGIMGLAYPSSRLARDGVSPVFDNIMTQKLVKQSIFGYYLGPKGGMVTFGAIDRKYIHAGSEFVYAEVTHQGYWTVAITDILLSYPNTGQVSTGVCKGRPNGSCKAIIDTGTYLVYGPAPDVKGALRDIQSSTCDRTASLPSITFVFQGQGSPAVTLSPKDYTLEFRVPTANVPADECSQAQYDHPDGTGIDPARCTLDCVTGIAPDADTLWTLGQVFLRNFYTVFDRQSNRVGFARSVEPGAI